MRESPRLLDDLHHIVGVGGKQHCGRHDAVVGSIGGVLGAAAGVDIDVAPGAWCAAQQAASRTSWSVWVTVSSCM